MTPEELIEEKQAQRPCSGCKRCSDYDEECIDVKDHILCFFGDLNTGIADGYCPFVQNPQ